MFGNKNDLESRAWYYIENGKRVLLSKAVNKQVNRENLMGEVHTGGKTLYPVLRAPEMMDKTKIPATCIRDGYCESVMWYWQICEHDKRHYDCTILDASSGLCGRRMVRYLNWNHIAKQWEIEPMVNAATDSQIKVLEHQL